MHACAGPTDILRNGELWLQTPHALRPKGEHEKCICFKTPATWFIPLKRQAAAGFIVLKDSQPDQYS